MMHYIKNIKVFLIALVVVLSGCNATEFDNQPIKQIDETLLTISFTDKDADTRALGDQVLTKESLSFFLFQKTSDNGAEFVFSPDVNKTTISKDNGIKNTYTVNFKIPDKEYGEIKLIVLKDYAGLKPTTRQSLTDFTKANLISKFKDIITKKGAPFYGITSFKANKKLIETSVILRNPLAKINLVVDDDLFDPTIHNYMVETIASVRVYRALDKAAIAVDVANVDETGIVFKPTIPSDAQYYLNNGTSSNDIAEADKNPILFDTSSNPVKSFTDKISIAEVYNKPDDLRKNVAAVIVGVYLTNPKYAGQQRYYRLDFADYDEGDLNPKKFLSVLRNHIYKFTLGGAQTPGEGDPEEALTAESSLWLDLKVWNDEQISSIINGEYYLSMESSDIKLAYTANSTQSVPFKTNIEEDLESAIGLSWGDDKKPTSQYFTAKVVADGSGNSIQIETKSENATAFQRIETLHVTVMNHAFKFQVIQKDKRPDFYISQTDYTVNGVYVRNQPMQEGVHTIRVRLYARDKSEDLYDLKYEISANPMEGISIDETSGFFNDVKIDSESGLQYQDVVLQIKGMSPHAKNKRLTILASGKEDSFLNAVVPYAYIPKKILGLFGASSINKLTRNTNFNRLIHSQENYGVTVNSTVKAENITYVESSDSNLATLISAENPDVIIWGDGYSLSNTQIDVLKNYMISRNELNGPGVVLAMNANASHSINLFSALNMVSGVASTATMTHEYYNISPVGTNVQARYRLPVYDWDLGVSGSFGDLGTKYINLPLSSISITNLNFEFVLKYTGNLAFAQKNSRLDFAVSSCRLANYPLFWVGSNDFINNQEWNFSGNKLQNLPETVYTSAYYEELYTMKLTNNSVFFANLLEWAFHTSEYGLNN